MKIDIQYVIGSFAVIGTIFGAYVSLTNDEVSLKKDIEYIKRDMTYIKEQLHLRIYP